MTIDPVEAVIAAYLEHLEHGGPEPSLEQLTEEDRRRAEDLIALMLEGRGIDVYRSRPSLDMLLAGTEFEDWLSPPATEGLSIDSIRADVVGSLGSASEPIVDGAAQHEGIRSDAIVRFQTLRLRLQFRDDIATGAGLARVDPRAAAGPIFGRFADTPAVVLVIGDDGFSSVTIDPYDTEEFIGTPDGQTYPPRITRPVLPLQDTLRRLVDELTPDLTIDDIDNGNHVRVDLADIIKTECVKARAAVVTEGKKARTGAKKETWPNFDELPLLVSFCETASAGELAEAELSQRIAAAAAAA
jgi:hypothetical protein